jgi:Tfp pilus assembly protein PilW
MRRQLEIRDESGTTLVELLVATAAGVVVIFAITTMVITSMHQTLRVNTHVDATQRARTVLTKVVEELHSACVAPQIAPVQEKSNGTSLNFIHQTGSAVSPTPVLSKVTLSGGTLSQSNYAVSGGSAPSWTFSGTASSTEQLMTNISPISPSTSIFSYYSYSNGETTALPTELSEENAKRAVKVDIDLAAAPQNSPISDANAAANISDSALLRFTSPAFSTSTVNLPCE